MEAAVARRAGRSPEARPAYPGCGAARAWDRPVTSGVCVFATDLITSPRRRSALAAGPPLATSTIPAPTGV